MRSWQPNPKASNRFRDTVTQVRNGDVASEQVTAIEVTAIEVTAIEVTAIEVQSSKLWMKRLRRASLRVNRTTQKVRIDSKRLMR